MDFPDVAARIDCVKHVTDLGSIMTKKSLLVLGILSTSVVQAQQTGFPASDTLGADDLWGNPTFIGGVANGGGTAHGVW